ncbi:DUF6343 family protein [Marinactinospora thermotolerans]|uniref:Uncharacterized protein n=1 Tax=Marinactinospora thermotolerans DSM 45154 TaxID=1122192 RepID=A0A1T4R6L4_9ACTN|nr:DUF6343 family protein [Marinactinospora thermotolerans]SKA11466.1 hypothetical protein SAMN02745673_02557 [Marinactinospora thermotolerans DSM 45154]
MRGGERPGRPARGTPERPRSALNLRLALAILGVVMCVALGVLALVNGFMILAVLLGVLAIIGVVDICVVIVRRRRRGSGYDSLFE